MIKKFKNKSGETLVETLVSMLIAVLSMGILCTAVMAATKLNSQTREMDEKYSSELYEVEGLDENADKKLQTLTVTFESADGSILYQTTTVDVTLYGSDEGAFLSYDYTPEHTSQEDTP